jgi:hypothetical protein
MEKGWLKPILEQASADREGWPAWQLGQEINESAESQHVDESCAHQNEGSEDHKTAA